MGDRKEPTPMSTDQVRPEPPPATPNVMRVPFAAAFEKWMADYNHDPSKFEPIDGQEQKTYGEASADHFIRILDELSGGGAWLKIGL